MPSKKTFAILIICAGVVTSFWLVTKNLKQTAKPTQGSVVEIDASNSVGGLTGSDWKNILLTVDTGTTTNISNEVGKNTSYPNEGTRTDQMAKDFLAQYLVLKQGGSTVSTDQASKIAQNILSSPSYTNATGVVYTSSNLHITSKTDKETAAKYMSDGVALMAKYSNSRYENELVILKRAVDSKKESELAKLDPIIANYKGLIAESLQMTVPSDAVTAHLALLNAVSNVLANSEAMRVTFSDPVRSFAGVSQYKQHVADVGIALNNLSAYFKSKGLIQ